MRVVMASDHAGRNLMEPLAEVARSLGHEVYFVGPLTEPKVDYPVAARALCDEIAAGRADRGILMCGSGAGVTVAANSMPLIRAAATENHYSAHQMVEHDHVNVLLLGGRVTGIEPAREIAAAFLNAEFTGEARHAHRLRQVIQIKRERHMNPLYDLHETGQRIWLDYIRRDILDNGTLARYIDELSVTGLTSNPSIFDKAIADTNLYDGAIGELYKAGITSCEDIFFELAIQDLQRAAKLFKTTWDVSGHTDGCVSLEVSPLLANDTDTTIEMGSSLFERADAPNLMIKVPGTPEGAPAIEELIARGVNINVTLLFSETHYRRAAEAYIRGLERRAEAGGDLNNFSVASVFVSRWDKAVMDKLPADLKDKLGIAASVQCYRAYKEMFSGPRWEALAAKGASPQKLLFASTSTKDPAAPDTYYVSALAADETVNTIPEATLLAFADHGEVTGTVTEADFAGADDVIRKCNEAGVDVEALGEQLQIEGRDSFNKSWHDLMEAIEQKSKNLQTA
ncbi:MAG: transaldolase [Phycisphaerales bacterium]|nr:transaldolase [Phycisphaerales bacterium]